MSIDHLCSNCRAPMDYDDAQRMWVCESCDNAYLLESGEIEYPDPDEV